MSIHAAQLSGSLVGEPHRKLRVCVLHPSMEGTTGAFNSSVDSDCKPQAYDEEGRYEWTDGFLRKASSTAQVVELVNSGLYDVFLNLCDGAWDEDRAGKEVVESLDRLNVPYTGADAAFYEPSKIDMKMAAHLYGITVPAWVHIRAGPAREEAGVAQVLAPPERGGLRFPLIVKHPSGYGSVGMTRESKVFNEAELRVQVSKCVASYGGALVEEFIAGREFTVLVVEEPGASSSSADEDTNDVTPVAYVPVECVFGPGEDFKHFDLKWTDYESMSWRPCDDPKLVAGLKAAACDAFLATRGVSYGRSDFRVDVAGNIFLLEINPNCGVLYPPGQHGSADYILTLDLEHDHRHFIATIISGAIQRHRCRQPLVLPALIHSTATDSNDNSCSSAGDVESKGAVHAAAAAGAAAGSSGRPGAGGSWGLVAQRAIPAGTVVLRNEQKPHTLVSTKFALRAWPEGSRQRRLFESYSIPIGNELWLTKPEDLTQWAPLVHSLKPNAAMDGLNVVARRNIECGEAISIDYNTFCSQGSEGS